MEGRCGCITKDIFSNTWGTPSHKAKSVAINGSGLSLGRGKSALPSQCLGSVESSLSEFAA